MTTEFALFHRFRVRFAEVDGQGVAFNSRYLEYADIVLTEFFRTAGIPLTGPGALEMHVVQANVHYRQPLRFDDEVEGWTRINRIGRSSIAFEFELRVQGSNAPAALIELHYVHIDLGTGKSAEISQDVRDKIQNCFQTTR